MYLICMCLSISIFISMSRSLEKPPENIYKDCVQNARARFKWNAKK